MSRRLFSLALTGLSRTDHALAFVGKSSHLRRLTYLPCRACASPLDALSSDRSYVQSTLPCRTVHTTVPRVKMGIGCSVATHPVVGYEEVRNGLLKNSIVLIDVRNEHERRDPGRIPGSFHIPLSKLSEAFKLSDEAFEKEYDFKKPSFSADNVVLTCLSGRRAASGADKLSTMGYYGINVYSGSLKDWTAKGGRLMQGHGFEHVDFETVKKGTEDQSLVVVDVRNPKERINPGRIPGTFNVPLSDIFTAFQMDPTVFIPTYGFRKPVPDAQNLVLHCKSGKRATDAAEKLSLLGYTNVKVYKGSFSDWESHGGKVLKTPERFMDREELKAAIKDGSVVLIDVRSEKERYDLGVIPGSVSIPLPELEKAFASPPDLFESTYGFPKPYLDNTLVTHCMSGMRARVAAEKLAELGFEPIVYKGSFLDWRHHQEEICRLGGA